jgi:hypothetical protein
LNYGYNMQSSVEERLNHVDREDAWRERDSLCKIPVHVNLKVISKKISISIFIRQSSANLRLPSLFLSSTSPLCRLKLSDSEVATTPMPRARERTLLIPLGIQIGKFYYANKEEGVGGSTLIPVQ